MWRHSSSRHLVGHVLRHLPFAERVRRDSRSAVEAWLTPHARRLAAQADDAIVHEERAGSAIHPAFSLRASQGSSREVQLAARQGIEPRDPYRDRRLAEFMLRVPAHMLLRDGRLKHLVRAAMYGILPEGVRLRVTPTQLDPLLRRGLVEREGKMLQDLLDQGRDLWAPFVKPNKLQHIVETELPAGRKDAVALVPWNCAAFCLWPFNRASAGASTSSASARGEAVIEDRPLPVSRDAEKPIAPPRTYSPPAVEHVEPLHVAVLGGSPGGTDSGGTPEYPPTVPTPPAPRPGGTSEEGMPTAWEPSAWEPPPQEPPAQPVQPWGPPETPSL